MEKITLIRCDDGAIWTTSDEDQIGTETMFDKVKDEGKQMLIALADFLGYKPAHVLNFEDDYDYDFDDDWN